MILILLSIELSPGVGSGSGKRAPIRAGRNQLRVLGRSAWPEQGALLRHIVQRPVKLNEDFTDASN